MSKPTSETSQRIKEAAKLRVEGASWEKIAILYQYKNADSARKTLQGEHPELWREAFEHARSLYLDEIESEALLTQRDLIRPHKETKDGIKVERDERIRQSAAHSLLVHSSRMRAQKIEVTGQGGGPVTFAQCQGDKEWLKQRQNILEALNTHTEAKEAVLNALRGTDTDQDA